jgi:hypothetical protein
MNTVLVPINDSSDIECAIKHVIERYRTQPVTLFLLNVQMPISKFVTRFVGRRQIDEFHQENGMQILQPMIEKLDAAGIPHQERIVIGHKATRSWCPSIKAFLKTSASVRSAASCVSS